MALNFRLDWSRRANTSGFCIDKKLAGSVNEGLRDCVRSCANEASAAMNLLDLAWRQRWSALAVRAASHRGEIYAVDENGFTALHWACFNQPDPRAVRAVLQIIEEEAACDAAVDVRDAEAGGDPSDATMRRAAMRNVALAADKHEGMTALHAACCSHASTEVIAALVRHCPAAVMLQDRSGWTPLHFSCHTALSVMEQAEPTYTEDVARILIEAEPTVVLCVDRHGNTALEVFVSLFGNLVENDWTLGGKVPAESADQWFWSVASLLIRESASHFRRNISSSTLPGDDEEQRRDDLPILHQIALLPPLDVSDNLVLYIAAKFPDQLKEVDADGNLPLHVAAEVYHNENNTFPLGCSDHSPDVIRALLGAYPAAAKAQNNNKQLPLSVAIQSGRSWEGGIEDIFERYPEALQSCDIECKLYPFLLARIAATYNSSAQTTLLRVLRSKPDLCQSRLSLG